MDTVVYPVLTSRGWSPAHLWSHGYSCIPVLTSRGWSPAHLWSHGYSFIPVLTSRGWSPVHLWSRIRAWRPPPPAGQSLPPRLGSTSASGHRRFFIKVFRFSDLFLLAIEHILYMKHTFLQKMYLLFDFEFSCETRKGIREKGSGGLARSDILVKWENYCCNCMA
jgi:hypothetical protein